MKKIITVLLMFLLLVSMLPASQVVENNRQKIYSVDSSEYEAMKYLYIASGLALPSTTGPWSASEMDLMLSRIDRNSLSESALETYNYLERQLGKEARINPSENFGLDIGMRVGVEMLAHTNPKEFDSLDDFGGKGDWRAQLPLISIPLETWIGSSIYGYSSFDLGINRTYINGIQDSNFLTNIIMVPPSVLGDLNMNFPYRAFGSIGGDVWNLSVGRDKLKWGPGESGNLIIGDQIPYHNNARFSAFTDAFKYTFSFSSFIHPMNYTKKVAGKEYLDLSYSQTAPREGLSAFIAHRLEWRIVDKINMALTEAIMYQSKENQLDLLALSPTAIFHNYYIRGNANSIISLEMDYTPIKYLNLYGEFALDEFKLPGEFTTDGPPSAYGFILGAKTSYPYRNGMFYGSLEAAYTDPYLYLRDDGTSYDPNNYGINFVVAIPEFTNEGTANYTLDFLGYRYGNDSVVGNLNFGYKVFGSWFADLDFTYLADGCFDMNTRWDNDIVPGSPNDPSAPSTDHPHDGSYEEGSNWDQRNAVAHWTMLRLSGGITLFENLDIFGSINYINIQNYQNIKGQKADDFQFTLGLTYYI